MPQSTDQLISDPAAGVHADSMEALHTTHPTPVPEGLKPLASASKTAAAAGAAKSTAPKIADELAATNKMRDKATEALPKMHDGGPVVADGAYQLKAGEHVLTAPQAKMARHHALMVVGMKRGLSKPAAQAATAGQPTAVDKAHKAPEKKKTKGVTVRPEKNQSAKIVDKTKK